MLIQNSDAFQALVQQQQEIKEQKTAPSVYDGKFIKFQRGNTYKFRLLYTQAPEDSLRSQMRTGPFIELFNHGTKNSDGYYKSVVCPTTKYGNKGFDKCPICKNNTKLWKSHEEGSKADKELYDLYKRKFHGYAQVYVINDPTTPENNGNVKLMHYTKGCKDFFAENVFSPDADSVGFDAFFREGVEGYDFSITVGEKAGFNNYSYKFSNKASVLDIDVSKMIEQLKEIDFDGNGIVKTVVDAVAIEKFYSGIVLGNDDSSNVSIPTTQVTQPAPAVSEATSVDIDDVLDSINTTPVSSAPVETPVSTPAPTETSEEDLEELLASLNPQN